MDLSATGADATTVEFLPKKKKKSRTSAVSSNNTDRQPNQSNTLETVD